MVSKVLLLGDVLDGLGAVVEGLGAVLGSLRVSWEHLGGVVGPSWSTGQERF